MHDKFIDRILNMKTHWIEMYPNSDIPYKASCDIGILDNNFAKSLRNFTSSFMVVSVGLIIWVVMYSGLLLLVLIPLAVYIYWVVNSFLKEAKYYMRYIAEDRAVF